MIPRPFRRPAGLSLALLCGLSLSGCGLPTPVSHVQLAVDAQGGYVLDHQAVSAADLPRLLAERHVRQPDLLMKVHASPQADIHAVQLAVRWARDAQVRVAFADEYNAQQ